jgi:hypothetical protein
MDVSVSAIQHGHYEDVPESEPPRRKVVEALTVHFMRHFAGHVVEGCDALSVFDAWASAYVNMANRAAREQKDAEEARALLREVLLAAVAMIDRDRVSTRSN